MKLELLFPHFLFKTHDLSKQRKQTLPLTFSPVSAQPQTCAKPAWNLLLFTFSNRRKVCWCVRTNSANKSTPTDWNGIRFAPFTDHVYPRWKPATLWGGDDTKCDNNRRGGAHVGAAIAIVYRWSNPRIPVRRNRWRTIRKTDGDVSYLQSYCRAGMEIIYLLYCGSAIICDLIASYFLNCFAILEFLRFQIWGLQSLWCCYCI